MTSEEMARKIVAELERLGCVAKVHENSGGDWSVLVAVARSEADEPVFRIGNRVAMLALYSLKLDRLACRAQVRELTQWADISKRCAVVAEVARDTIALRAAKALAWEVRDELTSIGLPTTVRDGRVVLSFDFTPDYAREMGPRIAALLAERKDNA